MARVVTPLNNTQIKAAKAKEKNFTLSDGLGLQLLVKVSGVKLWEFYYKSPTLLKRKNFIWKLSSNIIKSCKR